jgi:DNA-directed RNA polymerase subunit RPC12/RpoP
MGHVCPKCGSKIIDRVKRQDLLERLVLFLRCKRVYRCLDCDYRFYDRPQTKPR